MPGESPLQVALAHVIRERREALGLSQEDVGDLHRNSVGKIERAEIAPTVVQLARIGAALGVPGSELLRNAEQRAEGGDLPPIPSRPKRRGARTR